MTCWFKFESVSRDDLCLGLNNLTYFLQSFVPWTYCIIPSPPSLCSSSFPGPFHLCDPSLQSLPSSHCLKMWHLYSLPWFSPRLLGCHSVHRFHPSLPPSLSPSLPPSFPPLPRSSPPPVHTLRSWCARRSDFTAALWHFHPSLVRLPVCVSSASPCVCLPICLPPLGVVWWDCAGRES